MVATCENYSGSNLIDSTCTGYFDGTPYYGLFRDIEKIFKDSERELKRYFILQDIRYKSNEFKLDRTIFHKHKAPKTINRKLSQYSCSMRGRNKPCRRVAIVNKE